MARSVVPVAIALGSNLGDRQAHLQCAVDRLAALLADARVSPFRETAPEGVRLQPDFLNGAVVGTTTLSAEALLAHLLNIEAERGR
jgi:2-amino-4-hydroxy-6-hydroxymethyldihydropteridine diphosphokinase